MKLGLKDLFSTPVFIRAAFFKITGSGAASILLDKCIEYIKENEGTNTVFIDTVTWELQFELLLSQAELKAALERLVDLKLLELEFFDSSNGVGHYAFNFNIFDGYFK